MNAETTFDAAAIQDALNEVTAALLNGRDAKGHWEGELSSSALSTATAIFAIHLYEKQARESHARLNELVDRGAKWLMRTQNEDGGWGDTTLSLSNISTTALCWAALAHRRDDAAACLQRAEAWLVRAAGSLQSTDLAKAIKARYGKDHTFSVPILTMCALAGRLGEGRLAWKHIPQLPFELAACPHQWFRWIRLPVVSYALPALISMGQVRHAHRPSWNLAARTLRAMVRRRTLRLLQEIQPTGGGFLEATPLTSFVVMSLVGAGESQHPVARNGVDFLARSARGDGSWPIDTNLSTWLTTLSVNALAEHAEFETLLPDEDRGRVRQWLMDQQYRVEHPYTHARPGAWAWTDLPGGVPDADDTAGALLALWNLGERSAEELQAVHAGVTWLLDIQNRDGGIPTFCRGWGNLPFDRSGCDLTAHALHAWSVWLKHLDAALAARVRGAIAHGLRFLAAQQRSDGSWVPLWFGNQFCPNDENGTYGTAKVLAALCAIEGKSRGICSQMCHRAAQWLVEAQQLNGGWGGSSAATVSIEETALAVHALASWRFNCQANGNALDAAIHRGTHWLIENAASPRRQPAPIGFYFAKLWYFEPLYPTIFTCEAMSVVAAQSRV